MQLLRLLCISAWLVLALATLAQADDVGITSARLLELSDGRYALEADVSPMMVAVLGNPVLPPRFTLADRPVYRRTGAAMVVQRRFEESSRARVPHWAEG